MGAFFYSDFTWPASHGRPRFCQCFEGAKPTPKEWLTSCVNWSGHLLSFLLCAGHLPKPSANCHNFCPKKRKREKHLENVGDAPWNQAISGGISGELCVTRNAQHWSIRQRNFLLTFFNFTLDWLALGAGKEGLKWAPLRPWIKSDYARQRRRHTYN